MCGLAVASSPWTAALGCSSILIVAVCMGLIFTAAVCDSSYRCKQMCGYCAFVALRGGVICHPCWRPKLGQLLQILGMCKIFTGSAELDSRGTVISPTASHCWPLH